MVLKGAVAASQNGKEEKKKIHVSGKSGDLAISSWKERLSELFQGYKAEDIFNLDKTVYFWRAFPKSGFRERERSNLVVKRARKGLKFLGIINF